MTILDIAQQVNQQALSEARNRNVQHVAEIKARRKQGGAHVSGTSMLSDLDLPKDPLAEEDAYTQVVNDEVTFSDYDRQEVLSGSALHTFSIDCACLCICALYRLIFPFTNSLWLV